MHSRPWRIVVAGLGAAAVVAAPPASAKEDVKATLITAIPLDAPAGTELEVAWRLFYLDEKGKRQPFGASGLFVRLLSASGAASEEGAASSRAHDTGEYEATVLVPDGGIHDIELGLAGWVSDANGTRRSDLIFPITNDPVPRPGAITSAAPGRSVPAASDAAAPTRLLVVAASLLSLLALVVAAFVIRRRRYRMTARP
jgi:hypothetical protein